MFTVYHIEVFIFCVFLKFFFELKSNITKFNNQLVLYETFSLWDGPI